jgi:hypothetical protein
MSELNESCLWGPTADGCNDEPLPTAMCHSPHCLKQTGASLQQLRLAR